MTELIFSEMDKEICDSHIIKYHLNPTALAAAETGDFLKEVYADNKLERPLNNALMLDKLSSVEQKTHVST
ncbi:BAH_G0002540.mRNA.1.CDS.1 [Saccharomyces cerevisiae]|nr:BAH_G0002540.mRNA.1.CDS.1 [Saccharomyces cerevisiae]CAI7042844.1 BAH_G0002540.mRNA.1.CDS.1 [Saccharomyces cerevisiae]